MAPKKITNDEMEDINFDDAEVQKPVSPTPVNDEETYLPTYPMMSSDAAKTRSILLKQPRVRWNVPEDTVVTINMYRIVYKQGTQMVPTSVDKILANKFGIEEIISKNPMRLDRDQKTQDLTAPNR